MDFDPCGVPFVVFVILGGATLVAGDEIVKGGRTSLTEGVDTGAGEGEDAHLGEGVDLGECEGRLEGGVGVLCGRGVVLPG